jgi:hypothetical protein
MPYVYHLCADDFRGDELLPLNLLATRFPDIHDREMRKWSGRESVVRFAVPHLGVAWGDTVTCLRSTRPGSSRRDADSACRSQACCNGESCGSQSSASLSIGRWSTRAAPTGETVDPTCGTCPRCPRTPTSHHSTQTATRSSPKFPRCIWVISTNSERPGFLRSVSCSSGTCWSLGPLTSPVWNERGSHDCAVQPSVTNAVRHARGTGGKWSTRPAARARLVLLPRRPTRTWDQSA